MRRSTHPTRSNRCSNPSPNPDPDQTLTPTLTLALTPTPALTPTLALTLPSPNPNQVQSLFTDLERAQSAESPEGLEDQLEMYANADAVTGDTAARNMAIIMATSWRQAAAGR